MPEDATVQQILEAERDLYRAMIAQDFAALERILAPDLVYVHSTAVAETKQEYLQGRGQGPLRIRRHRDARYSCPGAR